jgi:Restriction endonuclease fold toxin 3
VLRDSFSFLAKIGVKGVIHHKDAIVDALKLAREGSTTALEAIKSYNFSFNKFRDLFGANHNVLNLIKVAKFGMFAPETAKAMGKCGSDCISNVGRLNAFYRNKSFSEKVFVGKFESDFKFLNLDSPEGVKTTGVRILMCVGSIITQSITSLSFEDECKKIRTIKIPKLDPHADALAAKIGGESRMAFDITDPNSKLLLELDPEFKVEREFDVITDKYIAQAKMTAPKENIGSRDRDQIKATFVAAKATGRQPYFQFELGIDKAEKDTILRYAERYKINPIIDLEPVLK